MHLLPRHPDEVQLQVEVGVQGLQHLNLQVVGEHGVCEQEVPGWQCETIIILNLPDTYVDLSIVIFHI